MVSATCHAWPGVRQASLPRQSPGIIANMVIPRLEGAPRANVDSDAQEFLKILEQADVIKKGGAWLEIHEKIQVAVRASLSPGDGAEHGDPVSPALPRDPEDLRAAAAEPLECQHVVGQPSSVSPRASTTLGTGGMTVGRWAIACRAATLKTGPAAGVSCHAPVT
jgi:hypothetical protein